MKTIWKSIKFEVKGKDVFAHGVPELDGHAGILDRDGMAFFFGKDRDFYVANIGKGLLRMFSTPEGHLAVDDDNIDYMAISQACSNGYDNAVNKLVRYAGVNRYDGFRKGLCALTWMLYPDGRYFADEYGFGMEDNREEEVYAIINADLEIVEPFKPIDDIAGYLKNIRKDGKTVSRIYNLIIIDESGSMHSIRKEAIDSVNETVQTIRAAQKKHRSQEHFVTLVTFNDDVKTVYECVPVDKVMEMTSETYRPDCCTALYDAMGMSLNALRKKVDAGDKVLVTIVTDGYENSSREYSGKAIKTLVDELKSKGWVFAYIGANQDVEAVAATISITNVMNFEATSAGTAEMAAKLGGARMRLFDRMADCCFSAAEANEDFFNED